MCFACEVVIFCLFGIGLSVRNVKKACLRKKYALYAKTAIRKWTIVKRHYTPSALICTDPQPRPLWGSSIKHHNEWADPVPFIPSPTFIPGSSSPFPCIYLCLPKPPCSIVMLQFNRVIMLSIWLWVLRGLPHSNLLTQAIVGRNCLSICPSCYPLRDTLHCQDVIASLWSATWETTAGNRLMKVGNLNLNRINPLSHPNLIDPTLYMRHKA